MEQKKRAVICPGMGYHRDKPLLYFAAKLAQQRGYELLHIEYHDLPQKIRGDAGLMQRAAELAYQQTAEQLSDAGLHTGSLLLIGKSIGTVAAARFATAYAPDAVQLWYTPLAETFRYAPAQPEHCMAFVGTADPWSDIPAMQKTAADMHIPLHTYDGCNHSLESADALRNLDILRDVMHKTAQFLPR